MSNHKIYFGDSRALNKIEDKSVQLIITSPPYWQLKDYGTDEQIGFNSSYEEYINNLNLVWQECERVLDDGCRLCINIGDQFARSIYYGRYKIIPIRTEIIRFCETLKLDYMGAIIWQKTTTMNTSGGGAIMGSFPYPRNGILKMDYEFILLFKKQGNSPKPTVEQKQKSIISKEEWKEYFASHWHFPGVKQNSHIAMFPEELPKRLIKMFSFEGETVFDPFMGSATTSLAALNTNRNSIGYEINKDFEPVMRDKLNICNLFSQNNTVEFLEDNSKKVISFDKLPYIFIDPHKLDKKVDIKKLQFGSKIDKNSKKKEKLFSVKEVISSNKLLLSDGNIIKLKGILEKKEKTKQAIKFLKDKFNGRKIFLKQDTLSNNKNEDISSYYVYLDNKTFINNHLVRTGFVNVDTESEYTNKEKFIRSIPV